MKVQIILASIALSCQAVAVPTSSGSCSADLHSNSDCYSADITSVPGSSTDDCCAACKETDGCGAFVWVQGGQYDSTCFLKTHCDLKPGSCAGSTCTAGTITTTPAPPPSPPTPSPPPVPPPSGSCSADITSNADCYSADITSVPGNSTDECCAACMETDGCGAFVWVQGGQYDSTCYLKTHCDLKLGSCGGSACTAGTVDKPGITDQCKDAPTQCSAEICDLKPGQVQRLKPGTYYHNKQIFLPKGSAIIGAGINVTYIVACGPPLASGCNMAEKRGFLMGDDTYVGNFSFAGRENTRSGCVLGGGMIETPGCQGDYCGFWNNGGVACNPPDRSLEQCTGIANATAEYIHLYSWTMDHIAWFPPTTPWGEDGISGSKYITLRGLTSWGTWADGINFHGGHKYALVEKCEISYTSDDPIGLWPQATYRPGFENIHDPRDCSDNIIIRNNIARYPRLCRGPTEMCNRDCSHPQPCWSLWGTGSNTAILDNHCEEAYGPVSFHNMYTNVKNIEMWCGPVAVDGNSYSNPGYCSSRNCQAQGDDNICLSAPSWPTDGVIGEDLGCGTTPLPADFRENLWKGFPSVAFPSMLV